LCIAVAVVMHQYQVTPQEEASYLGYFLVVVVLPGALLWRFVMPDLHSAESRRMRWLETFVCGAALGYVIEIPSYCMARWLGHPRWYVVVPIAIALASAPRVWKNAHRAQATLDSPRFGPGPAWALAAICAYAAVWLAKMEFSVLPLRPVGALGDPDSAFHLALIGELRHHFPAIYPYVETPALTYQYFVHVHMAASTWLTGLTPVDVYRRFDPMILMLLAVLGTAVVTNRLCGRAWVSILAPAILVLVGAFDITGTTRGEAAAEERFLQAGILVHSPTQTFAYVLAIPAMVLAVHLLTHRRRNEVAAWILLIAVLSALSGSKVTYVPMFAAGFALVFVVEMFRARRLDTRALIGLVACIAVIAFSAAMIYHGDTRSLTFNPAITPKFFENQLGIRGGGGPGEFFLSVSLLACWLVCGAGIVGLLKGKDVRRDPPFWWLVGAAAAGYGATVLLGHSGMSQLYFGRSAAPIVAILSAWGIGVLFPVDTSRRTALVAALAGAASGLAMFCLRLGTEQWRAPLLVKGKKVSHPVLEVVYNLPALLVIVVALFAISLLIKDLTGGRRRLSLRIAVVLLVGLGLARTYAFMGGDLEHHSVALVIPSDGIRAMVWLRSHSSPNDRVITNAHCGPIGRTTKKCDSRNFWMSAFSERRFVLEGWAYTGHGEEGWTGPFWGSRQFLDANNAVFTDPSGPRLTNFVAQHPAQWLVVDRSDPSDLGRLSSLPELTRRYSNTRFVIFRLN
jgi:hypothetical protein